MSHIVFVPGLLCDEALWQNQIEAFSGTHTTYVPHLTREDNIPDMARHILRRAPEKFSLAGLSMGGYVSLEVMRQAPERVERLALIDTNARADSPEISERRRKLMDQAQKGKFIGVSRGLLPMLVHEDFQDDPRVRDTVFEMAERTGLTGYIHQQTALIGRPDSRPDLKNITCPTLVLCGAQDALTPIEMHREIASGIGANAWLEVVEGAGHLAPLERPEEVNQHLAKWLET